MISSSGTTGLPYPTYESESALQAALLRILTVLNDSHRWGVGGEADSHNEQVGCNDSHDDVYGSFSALLYILQKPEQF